MSSMDLERDPRKIVKRREADAQEPTLARGPDLNDTVLRAKTDPTLLATSEALQLQQTIGNHAVGRRLGAGGPDLALAGYAAIPRSIGVARKTGVRVQRITAEEQRVMAGAGEEEQRAQMEEQPPPLAQVSNVADANQARTLMTEIEGYRSQMQDGGRTGTISGEEISANEQAIATLADYLVNVGEQGRTMSTYQQQVQQVRLDFGRVSGQMIHLEASGVVDRSQTAAFRAEQVVGAATGARNAEQSAAGLSPGTSRELQPLHDALVGKGNDVSRAQREANQAVHGLNSALSTLNSGIIPREENPELAAKQRAIKGKVSTMQSRLSTALTILSAIGGAAGIGTAATRVATASFGSTLTGLGQQAMGGVSSGSIASAISEEWYRTETNQIEAQIAQANAQQREAAITANVSGVREAQSRLFSNLRTLEERMTEFQQARDSLRTQMQAIGQSARDPRQREGYAIIGTLLGDVDVLVVQIDTTLSLGETERLAANQATEARGRVEGTRREGSREREGQISYYRPYRSFQLGNWGRTGGLVWKASSSPIYFVTPSVSRGSAYGGTGAANPVVEASMTELREMRQTVQGMRDVLSRSVGISMQR
jgi:hypothetical protein